MSRILKIFLLAGTVIIAVALGALAMLDIEPATFYRALKERTPAELVRYARRRLEGHPRLELAAAPLLVLIERHAGRPAPEEPLPALGKGQQERTLGLPLPGQSDDARPAAFDARSPATASLFVTSAAELVRAVESAKPGQVILVAPGTYEVSQPVQTKFGGTPERPIVVRANRPGQAVVNFRSLEGFIVSQPYWAFENLVIRGTCPQHHDCEHAFHIVGGATGTVLRNNRIEDFNAHVKVNGLNGAWPDNGLLQFNTLINNSPRDTPQPVALIDIVAANGWRVVDNVIGNFVKRQGDQISYGVFMKGAGRGGRIERNLIVCTARQVSQPGLRVALSFGDGGTGKAYCRDGRCEAEHYDGLAANNVIAHCNDFGIDVHRSVRTTIVHNTLINTAGIDVRDTPAAALVYGNLLDGRIRARNGAHVTDEFNDIVSLPDVLRGPDQLDLRWRRPPENIPSMPRVATDFCGRGRKGATTTGAIIDVVAACSAAKAD